MVDRISEVSAGSVMDVVVDQSVIVDYVISHGLAQASIQLENGDWFELQIQPRTRDEIIASFGQAD